MNEIRHIVFDLGRVLVRWEPDIPYRRLIPDDVERAKFLKEVCNSAWLLRTDLGVTWADAETELIGQHPQHEAMIRAFRRHWHDMVPGLVEGTPAVLADLLKAGHDVTALTNFAEDTLAEAAVRFPELKSFRGLTVSGAVRLAKPDPAIFRRHAADFALEPGATLFFDDVPANVEAARGAGWKAEIFTGADRMRADLQRHGVAL
jgi:HAD superfamily hydrolase (TIGR01509 family)